MSTSRSSSPSRSRTHRSPSVLLAGPILPGGRDRVNRSASKTMASQREPFEAAGSWDARSTSSGSDSVTHVDHAAPEAAFVQQFELQADIVGKRLLAASNDDRSDEQAAFVHQPRLERVGG